MYGPLKEFYYFTGDLGGQAVMKINIFLSCFLTVTLMMIIYSILR